MRRRTKELCAVVGHMSSSMEAKALRLFLEAPSICPLRRFHITVPRTRLADPVKKYSPGGDGRRFSYAPSPETLDSWLSNGSLRIYCQAFIALDCKSESISQLRKRLVLQSGAKHIAQRKLKASSFVHCMSLHARDYNALNRFAADFMGCDSEGRCRATTSSGAQLCMRFPQAQHPKHRLSGLKLTWSSTLFNPSHTTFGFGAAVQ